MDAATFASHRHPLNRRELLSGEESRVCGLCGKEVTSNGSAYECSLCDFSAHLDCAENPPSLMIDKSKIHEHPLTLLPRHVSFTCNACGLSGDKSPYVCLKCCFMVHRGCLNIPRVINISRHHHRLYRTCFLGPREWDCGVCRKRINGRYGAYNCVKGCDYAVHMRCALREDVWDRKELEKEPEEHKENGSSAFVDDNLIQHFSHQHVLKLEYKDIRDVVCSGCSLSLGPHPFYRCTQCDYVLHKTCAHLPPLIQMFLHVHPLTLCTEGERSGGPNDLSRCNACNLHFNGFSYRCFECDIEFDVRCSSVSEPFKYHFHQYHLLFAILSRTNMICSVCNQCEPRHVLSCIVCDFNLCFACATLPAEVVYKYDDHLLSHTIGEGVNTNPYWCDICENKIEEMRIHYKCFGCGPVLHTECAVGSFRNMRPGFSFITQHGHKYKVILNDRISKLRCIKCHKDCHEPLLLMSTSTDATFYLCSSPCLDTYVSV